MVARSFPSPSLIHSIQEELSALTFASNPTPKMKTQLVAVVAALSAMAASLTLEQPDQRGMDSLLSVTNPNNHGLLIHVPLDMDLLANTDGQGPMAARMSRPFPFSNPHTVEPRGLGETNSCSSVVSFET